MEKKKQFEIFTIDYSVHDKDILIYKCILCVINMLLF